MLRQHAAFGAQRSGSSPTFSIVMTKQTGICDPYSNLFQVVKKSLSSLIHGSNPEIKRVMNQKEKRKMTTITIIKMNETEAKRFWGVRKRLLTLPLSEKQIMRLKGDSYKDA